MKFHNHELLWITNFTNINTNLCLHSHTDGASWLDGEDDVDAGRLITKVLETMSGEDGGFWR